MTLLLSFEKGQCCCWRQWQLLEAVLIISSREVTSKCSLQYDLQTWLGIRKDGKDIDFSRVLTMLESMLNLLLPICFHVYN